MRAKKHVRVVSLKCLTSRDVETNTSRRITLQGMRGRASESAGEHPRFRICNPRGCQLWRVRTMWIVHAGADARRRSAIPRQQRRLPVFLRAVLRDHQPAYSIVVIGDLKAVGGRRYRRGHTHCSTDIPNLNCALCLRALSRLERDDFSSNRHPALSFCLSMIFSTNRYPLFRIML